MCLYICVFVHLCVSPPHSIGNPCTTNISPCVLVFMKTLDTNLNMTIILWYTIKPLSY